MQDTHGWQLDELDRKILSELSKDSHGSYRRLAVRVGVSPATFIVRVRRLEKEGVILGYSACLNFGKMGFEFTAVIEATITKGAQLDVQRKIAALPGVVAVYDVTGESDSMAIARCRTRSELSRLVKSILAINNVQRTNTHMVLNVIKEDNRAMPGLG